MTDDAKQPDVPLTEGEVLAGKYKVERILGRGGMGVVVAATHIHLRQKVAIKFLLPDATGEVVKRFLREARSAVRLRSEHVTRVLDVGELDTGAPFMVMEYLEGSDLSRVLRKRGALPIQEAIDYTLQACEAIAEAHSLGIVHRDLKPANLFVTTGADGSAIVKVLDFGISKDSGQNENGDEDNQLTRTTAVLGSPYYMAPEQMRSTRSVDARADIWSLGIILYQLVTKKVPFKADSFVELALMVVNEDPKPPSTLRPDLPPALEQAILGALKKKPDERFSTVAEFAAAIAPFGPASAIIHATRIARVQGAPVPIIERVSSVSIAPPPAEVATGSGSGPQSVAANSVPSSGVASAMSSGPSIPSAAQITHASPTAAPAQSIAPPAPAGQTTGSTTGSSTGGTGAAWTGSPTVQARRTGALIVGGGAVMGAAVVVALMFLMRPHTDSGSSAHAANSAAVGAEAQRAPTAAPTTVEVAPGSAVPSVAPAPAVSASASASASASVAAAPAPVGTGRTGSSSLTNRSNAPGSQPAAPANVAPAAPPPAAPPPVAPPPVATAAAPPPAPAPTVKKNVLDIDIK